MCGRPDILDDDLTLREYLVEERSIFYADCKATDQEIIWTLPGGITSASVRIVYNPNPIPELSTYKDYPFWVEFQIQGDAFWVSGGGSVGYRDSCFKTLSDALQYILTGNELEDTDMEVWLTMMEVYNGRAIPGETQGGSGLT